MKNETKNSWRTLEKQLLCVVMLCFLVQLLEVLHIAIIFQNLQPLTA